MFPTTHKLTWHLILSYIKMINPNLLLKFLDSEKLVANHLIL
jgi:hypothetical protein